MAVAIKKDFTGSDMISNGRGGINFRNLVLGDVLTARNGDIYIAVSGMGNNVINTKNGKYSTLNNDLTNPKSNSAGGMDIVKVQRWHALPEIHAFSESMKMMLDSAGVAGIEMCTFLDTVWVDESPEVRKARLELEAAQKAKADADLRVKNAQDLLNRYAR